MGMRSEQYITELSDAISMHVTLEVCPLDPPRRMEIIDFLQQEWERGDMDWLLCMRGAYNDTLYTDVAMGKVGEEVVGTATVSRPVRDPEICVVENVMTCPAYRGRGIAAYLTDRLVQRAFEAGCRVAYLGNAPNPRPVYERIGFTRIGGAIMRCAAPGQEEVEADLHGSGQKTHMRETAWGDMPGVACLMGQGVDSLMVDYLRGLVSPRHVAPVRCVSNFTTTFYDVKAHGGRMLTLVGATAHRVLGFATLTPGPAPARDHTAVIDVVTHDHYVPQTPDLFDRILAEAKAMEVEVVQAWVAATDTRKADWLKNAGLQPLVTVPNALRVGDRSISAVLFQK